MEVRPPERPITVEEFCRMGRAGAFGPEARVELIEGEIIDMPPTGPRHDGTVMQLTMLLYHAIGNRALIKGQGVIFLSDISAPQPDVALLKPRPDFYKTSHPTASDTCLIVEVSDSRLRYDLQRKVPLYARHNAPEVWVVDVKGGELHVFRSPEAGAYADKRSIREPGVIELAALPGVRVDLTGLLSTA
ncbi:MAG TPA: Uma2 family endonuclease [Steroidobacteraceae bacterium]